MKHGKAAELSQQIVDRGLNEVFSHRLGRILVTKP